MFYSIFRDSIFSHTKITTLTLLIGVSTVFSGCSVVMSPDNSSYVGAVADYTPFEMEDDSFFGNTTPKKPAYLQKSRTLTAFTPTNNVIAQQAQAGDSSLSSVPAASPSEPIPATAPQNPAITTASATSQPALTMPTTTATVTAATKTTQSQPVKTLEENAKPNVQAVSALTMQDKTVTAPPRSKGAHWRSYAATNGWYKECRSIKVRATFLRCTYHNTYKE